MNYRSLFAVSALLVSSAASANGGLSIDNIEQHVDVSAWAQTQVERAEITVQAPVDAFTRYMSAEDSVADTERLQQSYDGQS